MAVSLSQIHLGDLRVLAATPVVAVVAGPLERTRTAQGRPGHPGVVTIATYARPSRPHLSARWSLRSRMLVKGAIGGHRWQPQLPKLPYSAAVQNEGPTVCALTPLTSHAAVHIRPRAPQPRRSPRPGPSPLGGNAHLLRLLSTVSLTAVLTAPWTRPNRTRHRLRDLLHGTVINLGRLCPCFGGATPGMPDVVTGRWSECLERAISTV